MPAVADPEVNRFNRTLIKSLCKFRVSEQSNRAGVVPKRAQTPASLIKPTNWYARIVLKYQTSVLKRRKLRTSEKLARCIRYEALLTNASPVPKCGEKPGSFCGTRSNLLGCPSIRTQTHLLPLFAAPATTSTARQLANGRERCDMLLVQKGQRPGSRPL
jgi:hypothetical protein